MADIALPYGDCAETITTKQMPPLPLLIWHAFLYAWFRAPPLIGLRSPNGAVTVEMQLGVALWIFAGASYFDVAILYGIAPTTAVYGTLWMVDATSSTPEVGPLVFPQTVAQCQRNARLFMVGFDSVVLLILYFVLSMRVATKRRCQRYWQNSTSLQLNVVLHTVWFHAIVLTFEDGTNGSLTRSLNGEKCNIGRPPRQFGSEKILHISICSTPPYCPPKCYIVIDSGQKYQRRIQEGRGGDGWLLRQGPVSLWQGNVEPDILLLREQVFVRFKLQGDV